MTALQKLEKLSYDSANMGGLLAVLSRGAEAEQNYTDEYKENHYFHEDMKRALELASQFQKELAGNLFEVHGLLRKELEKEHETTRVAK